MDGLEATGAIREHERRAGEHVPIIALTANVRASDRDRCLEAGMDDYLSKPLRTEELRACLSRWTSEQPVPASFLEQAIPAGGPWWSPDRLAEIAQNDREFERELLGEFLHQLPDLAAQCVELAEAASGAALAPVAHKLRGSSAAVGAQPLAELASELEEAAIRGDAGAIKRSVAKLLEVLESTSASMREHLARAA